MLKSLFLVGAVLLGASCGSETIDNLTFTPRKACYATCTKKVSCMLITNSNLNSCQLACDDGQRGTEQCTNQDDIWKAVRDDCTKDEGMCTDAEKTGYEACIAAEKAKCMR